VEQILDAQGRGAARRWLVKWAGYDHEDNTWEPRENLVGSGVQQWVREFDRNQKKQNALTEQK